MTEPYRCISIQNRSCSKMICIFDVALQAALADYRRPGQIQDNVHQSDRMQTLGLGRSKLGLPYNYCGRDCVCALAHK